MYSKKKLLIITVAIVGVLAAALSVGVVSSQIVNAQGTYEDLRSFVDVLNVIQKNYVDEVKTKDLINGAIKGMLSSLDPHSGYMSPEAFKEFQVETKGEFGGLGIQSIDEGRNPYSHCSDRGYTSVQGRHQVWRQDSEDRW